METQYTNTKYATRPYFKINCAKVIASTIWFAMSTSQNHVTKHANHDVQMNKQHNDTKQKQTTTHHQTSRSLTFLQVIKSCTTNLQIETTPLRNTNAKLKSNTHNRKPQCIVGNTTYRQQNRIERYAATKLTT